MAEDLQLEPGKGDQPSSPLVNAATTLAKIGLGVAAYRYGRSTQLGREVLGKLSEVSGTRLWRTVQHASLPYVHGVNVVGANITEFVIDEFRNSNSENAFQYATRLLSQENLQLSGLTGLHRQTRTLMQHQRLKDKLPDIGNLGLRDRLKFEWQAAKRSLSTGLGQLDDIWKLHSGLPGMPELPGARASKLDRFLVESARASRLVSRDDSVLKYTELTRRIEALKNLEKPTQAQSRGLRQYKNLKRVMDLGIDHGVLDDALGASRRKGFTSEDDANQVFNDLLGIAIGKFSKAPRLGRLERRGLGKGWRAETLDDVVGRGGQAFLNEDAGFLKINRVEKELYQKLAERAGDTKLYTGRMINAQGKTWDPYEHSLRNMFFRAADLTSHFRIPFVGISPLQLLMPKELEQWWGEGRQVHNLRGGRYIWAGTGEQDHLGRQAGKLFVPSYGFNRTLDPGNTSTQLTRRIMAAMVERERFRPGGGREVIEGHLEYVKQLREEASDAAWETGKYDPEEYAKRAAQLNDPEFLISDIATRIRQQRRSDGLPYRGSAYGALRARQNLSLVEYQGLKPYAVGGKEFTKPVVLTPGTTALSRFLIGARGDRYFNPTPDGWLAYQNQGVEPGQEFPDLASRMAGGVVSGLSKVGIDWRNQRQRPIPVQIYDAVAGLFGRRKLALHIEDYTVDATEEIGGSVLHAHYQEPMGLMARKYLEDQMERYPKAGGSAPWVGLRTEPVPVVLVGHGDYKRYEIDREADVDELVTRMVGAGRAARDAGQGLESVGVNKYHGSYGKSVADGPEEWQWRTNNRRVYSRKDDYTVATGEQLDHAMGIWAASRPLEVLNMMGVGGFNETRWRSWKDPLIDGGLRVAGAYLGVQALRYADDKIEDATGFSPIKTAIHIGTGLDIFRHAVLTPMVYAGKALETLIPGSITSPLSYAARTFGPMAAGLAAAAYTKNPYLALAGVAAGLALSGDLTKTAGEMQSIYSGETYVPVRSSRYWSLSPGSFFGEQVTEWRPHWTALITKDARYSGYPYRDKSQYWATQPWLPVPENLFGIRPWITDRYAHDEYLNSVGAPTVMSSPSPITQIPLVGPLLTPLGALLKPTRVMHPELGLPTSSAEDAQARMAMESLAQRSNLQLAEEGVVQENIKSPYSIVGAAKRFLRYGEELLGIYGWMAGTATRGLLGTYDAGSPHYETAADAAGGIKNFYDWNLGGGFGTTEFLRRLLPRNKAGDTAISNVPNDMPSWMPGGDQVRATDWHTGNPFAKIGFGQTILPGKGYEHFRPELKGVSPEAYPSWARLEILTTAAPYSYEAREAAEQVATDLPNMTGKVAERAQHLLDAYEVTTGDTLELDNQSGLGKFVAGMFGLRSDKLGLQRSALDSFIRHRLLGSEMESWDNPIESLLLPAWRDMGRGGPLTGGIEGAGWGAVFGGNIVSRAMGAVVGGAVGSAMGIRHDIHDIRTGREWVAPENQKRMATQDYLDRLRFVKSVRNYQLSGEPGFLEAATRTQYGTDPFGETWRILAGLPASDRKYMTSFLQARGDQREQILSAVPGYMARPLTAQWMMQDAQAGELDDDQLEDLKQLKISSWLTNQVRLRGRDPELPKYFEDNYLPADSWAGWAPDVPIESAAYKMLRADGMDEHEFGIWQGEIQRFEAQKNQPLLPEVGTRMGILDEDPNDRLKGLLHPSRRQSTGVAVEGDREELETNIELVRSPQRDVRAIMRFGF